MNKLNSDGSFPNPLPFAKIELPPAQILLLPLLTCGFTPADWSLPVVKVTSSKTKVLVCSLQLRDNFAVANSIRGVEAT